MWNTHDLMRFSHIRPTETHAEKIHILSKFSLADNTDFRPVLARSEILVVFKILYCIYSVGDRVMNIC